MCSDKGSADSKTFPGTLTESPLVRPITLRHFLILLSR